MTEKAKNQVIVSDDSKRTINHIRERLERLQDEVSRLKALDYLLTSSSNEEIRELAWLIEPIATNMAAIQEELMEFSSTKGLAITTQTKAEAEHV
jgi:archaellum component FlaC